MVLGNAGSDLKPSKLTYYDLKLSLHRTTSDHAQLTVPKIEGREIRTWSRTTCDVVRPLDMHMMSDSGIYWLCLGKV